jgi:hypothetical protein
MFKARHEKGYSTIESNQLNISKKELGASQMQQSCEEQI